MGSIPTYLDRYPAKMVSHFAHRVVSEHARQADSIMDPFCGSGAILHEGVRMGVPVCGFDINPYAVLLSRVKLEGFDQAKAMRLWMQIAERMRSCNQLLPIDWVDKNFWFTPKTIEKYESIRAQLLLTQARSTKHGRAVLLAYALSVRCCSKADQRSPKPFISKNAKLRRAGKHFDPADKITQILSKLGCLYGRETKARVTVSCKNVALARGALPQHSHVITSPPYINAQDYFRNFKLELYLLADLLNFIPSEIQHSFVGTERGGLLAQIPEQVFDDNAKLLPELELLRMESPRLGAVVDRYFWDMRCTLRKMASAVGSKGTLIIICGDNLVAGRRIPTWSVLNSIIGPLNFRLVSQYGDKIERRHVPPKRMGHRALMKEEMVSVFEKVR